MALEKTGEQLPAAERAQLEAEHGPIVLLEHPDGSRFGFKILTRDVFTTRRRRIARKDADSANADDKMLQERCVWPSRDKWNAYVAGAAFEVLAYLKAYREVHGGRDTRLADPDEIPEGGDTAQIWITNGTEIFPFRKPVRGDVKQFQAAVLGQKDDALEGLIRGCAASPAFLAWLDANLFGIDAFGDTFIGASGMTEARAVAK